MNLTLLEGQLGLHVALLSLLLVITVVVGGCDKTEAILLIEKPTKVQDGSRTPYPPDYPRKNGEPEKIIAVLKPGDRVPVKDVYWGHDYAAYKVQLADGTKGYVIAGDTFKILPPDDN